MYKGYTQAQAAAYKRYSGKQATIYVRMPPEERNTIQAAAEAAGQSVNAYVRQAIQERMEWERQRTLDVRPGDGGAMVAYDRETGETYATSKDGINWEEVERQNE